MNFVKATLIVFFQFIPLHWAFAQLHAPLKSFVSDDTLTCVIDVEGAKCWPTYQHTAGDKKYLIGAAVFDPLSDRDFAQLSVYCDASANQDSCIFKLPIENPTKVITYLGKVCAASRSELICGTFGDHFSKSPWSWKTTLHLRVTNLRSLSILPFPYYWHRAPCWLDDNGFFCKVFNASIDREEILKVDEVRGATKIIGALRAAIDGGEMMSIIDRQSPYRLLMSPISGLGSRVAKVRFALSSLMSSEDNYLRRLKSFTPGFTFIVDDKNQAFQLLNGGEDEDKSNKPKYVPFNGLGRLKDPIEIKANSTQVCASDSDGLKCVVYANSKDHKPSLRNSKAPRSLSNVIEFALTDYFGCALIEKGWEIQCWGGRNISSWRLDEVGAVSKTIKVKPFIPEIVFRTSDLKELANSPNSLNQVLIRLSPSQQARYLEGLPSQIGELEELNADQLGTHYWMIRRIYSRSDSNVVIDQILPLLDSLSRKNSQVLDKQVVTYHLIAALRMANDLTKSGQIDSVNITETLRLLIRTVKDQNFSSDRSTEIYDHLVLLDEFINSLEDSRVHFITEVFQDAKAAFTTKINGAK